MDRAPASRAAVQVVCPHAQITVDTVHVITRVQEGVGELWRRLARGHGREDPLRRHGRLVLGNRERLTTAEAAQLREVLARYPDLRQAWLLTEDCRRW